MDVEERREDRQQQGADELRDKGMRASAVNRLRFFTRKQKGLEAIVELFEEARRSGLGSRSMLNESETLEELCSTERIEGKGCRRGRFEKLDGLTCVLVVCGF